MDILDKLGRYKGPLGRAFLSQALPGIMKGVMVEYFKKLDIKTIDLYVSKDAALFSMLTPEYQVKIRILIHGLDTSWLTTDWLILAIRKDYPAIASLFILPGDERSWLDKQIRLVRASLTQP